MLSWIRIHRMWRTVKSNWILILLASFKVLILFKDVEDNKFEKLNCNTSATSLQANRTLFIIKLYKLIENKMNIKSKLSDIFSFHCKILGFLLIFFVKVWLFTFFSLQSRISFIVEQRVFMVRMMPLFLELGVTGSWDGKLTRIVVDGCIHYESLLQSSLTVKTITCSSSLLSPFLLPI